VHEHTAFCDVLPRIKTRLGAIRSQMQTWISSRAAHKLKHFDFKLQQIFPGVVNREICFANIFYVTKFIDVLTRISVLYSFHI